MRIRARLRREGRLTFAAFMAEALYGPDGYYTRRPRLGGASADFFTAPELHPAFGALLGELARRVWAALGRPDRFDLVEHGPGTGALGRDLLTWASHAAPAFAATIHYTLVETSAPLQAAQRATLADAGLLDERIRWRAPETHHPPAGDAPHPLPLAPARGRGGTRGGVEDDAGTVPARDLPCHSEHDTLCHSEHDTPWHPERSEPASVAKDLGSPSRVNTGRDPSGLPLSRARGRGVGGGGWPSTFAGLILANELIDALPVHVVVVRDGILYERFVTLDGDALTWTEDEPSTPALAAHFERLGVWPAEGCLAEVNLAGVAWLETTAATLGSGALVVLDYGYPAPELYAPSRRHGTLLTYRAHTLGSDPLRHVGGQDITSHVDFTSLARAGERAGLETVGLISQAALLRRLGLDEYVRALDRAPLPAWDHDANRRALLTLIEPTGLGRIQALLHTRHLPDFDPFASDRADPGDAGVGEGSAEDDASSPAPTWLPLLRPGQMRLPGPLEAEGFVDLVGQWQELLEGADDDGDDDGDHDGADG